MTPGDTQLKICIDFGTRALKTLLITHKLSTK